MLDILHCVNPKFDNHFTITVYLYGNSVYFIWFEVDQSLVYKLARCLKFHEAMYKPKL